MRRRHLIGSLAALSTLPFAARTSAQPSTSSIVPASYDTFDEWIAAARSGSLQFLQTPIGLQPRHLISLLALWGAAMPRDPDVWQTPWNELPGANAPLEFNTLSAGRPFVVSAFRMAPGCLLPAHCHPGGGGITLCVAGELKLEHFNLEPGSADFRQRGGAARVRYESVAHLTPERYTWFTPEISNLHRLRAGPEGAIGVDLAVQWQGGGEFSFLRFADADAAQAARVGELFDGVWSGMNIVDAYA